MVWLWLLLAVAIIVSVPFFRFFIKRTIMLIKIKRYCKKSGYRIEGTHYFRFFGNRNRKKADLYIETSSVILSIKLFGPLRKNAKLIVKQNGDYIIRRYYAFLSSKRQALLYSDSKPKPFADYCFDIDNTSKPVRNILLVHPDFVELRHQPRHGCDIIIDSGDILHGMEIYTLKGFIKNVL